MIQIEKNIPLPEKQAGRKTGSFSELSATAMCMAIGDSIWLKEGQKVAMAKVHYVAKKQGLKFASRKDGEGTRLWRIA